MDDEKLFKKLRDLQALFTRATTPGERMAAGKARERILARLHALEQRAPAVEHPFTTQDTWSKRLFFALLRRYDLKPSRYHGQRRAADMARVPQRFVDDALRPHFERASQELRQHLDEVASKGELTRTAQNLRG